MEKNSENKAAPILANLWFDTQAEEAANFYTSIFKNSAVGIINRYGKAGQEIHGKAEGSVMTVTFSIENQEFVALNGGPHFKINPSISFFVNLDTAEEIDALWQKLMEDGQVLMPLDSYPFSDRYGWVQDKYGVSWQLILGGKEGNWRPPIIPSLLFVGEQCGRAEEALNLYTSVFCNSEIGNLACYGAEQAPDQEGTLMYADFKLNGQWFAAMDSAHQHDFNFNEGVSLVVPCETQEEIDYFWEKLSADPAAEQCGWLKDKFGVSWQIVPKILPGLLSKKTEKSQPVMNAMLQMKKLNIEELKNA